MANETDVSSTQWVAIIALFLVLLVPIAVALSWWLKQRYARAVVLLQASVAGTSAAPVAAGQVANAAPSAVPAPGAPPLVIQVVPAASTKAAGVDPTAPARRLRRRVLWTQFTLGLVYWFSLLLTAAIGLAYYSAMMQEPETTGGSSFASTMMFLPVLFVPPLLAWSLQAGTRQSVAWWIVVAGSISVAIGLALQEHSIVAAFAAPAVLSALGLMLTAFLRPSVRGAGPPLVAAMIVGFLVFAAFSMVAVALDDGSPSDDWGSWGEILAAIGLLLAVTALSAWVGWRMLLRISRRYTKKRFSELQLALGSYWGLMTLIILASVMMLAFEDKTGGAMEWVGLLVVLLWLAWRVAQRLALRWAVRRAAPARSPLLLLRVFKPSGRSEAFMDRFLARWRFAAPVWMIAGPDLAGALMEPDEFFAYLRRNLADRFISDAGQIPERLAGLDGERDPDGRFRVSELFCANSTWQPVVLAMIERAGVILLDLREYTAGRAGTRYELLELLRRAPLERVIFLSDEAGDAPQLRSIIEEAWQVVGRRSGQTVRIVQLRSESDAELEGVFRMAAQADGPDSMTTRRSTP